MSVAWAGWLLGLLGVYLGIGLAFAAPFVAVGVGRIDPVARGAKIGFRLLILPGSALLWPLLLKRWLAGPWQPPAERNPHREAAAR